MNSPEALVFQPSIKTKLVTLFLALFLIIIGAGVCAVVPGILYKILGTVLLLGGLYVGFALVSKKATLLVDREGIVPVYFVGKRMTRIPWSNIKRFDRATKDVPNVYSGGKVQTHFLAVYLYAPQDLGRSAAFVKADALQWRDLVSDGGTADFYIPAGAFTQTLDEVVRILEASRAKAGGGAVELKN